MQTNWISKKTMWLLTALILTVPATFAQTTEFTYQGRLADTGTSSPAYDFQFRLCAAISDCSTPLATDPHAGVLVSNGGIFTVKLNFGSTFFDGSDRFVEIAIKRPAESSYITLTPRQKLSSTPYTIQSLKAADAANLGGTAASQYVLTTDPRLSANNYVQNTTISQPGGNFNIGGTGTAGILNASTQFNLGGNRVLSNAGTGNLFAGAGAGTANTGQSNAFFGGNAGLVNSIGSFSSFFGSGAGRANTSGDNNSFFGSDAGLKNTTGFQNSFFGREAGTNTTTGNYNSFFGRSSGRANTTGESNSFFGQDSGVATTTGGGNAFYGLSSGQGNTTGGGNSFFGTGSGQSNKTGSNNTIIGANANVSADNLSNVTVIGSAAIATASNTVVLGTAADTVQVPGALNIAGTFLANILSAQTQINIGTNRILGNAGTNNLFAGVGAGAVNTGVSNSFFGRNAGLVNSTGNNNSFFGLSAGVANTTGGGNAFYGLSSGQANTTGGGNSFFGTGAGQSNKTGSNNTIIGSNANLGADNLSNSVVIGSGVVVSLSNTIAIGSGSQNTLIAGTMSIEGGPNNVDLPFPAAATFYSPNFGSGFGVRRLYVNRFPQLFINNSLCFQAGLFSGDYSIVGNCSSNNFSSIYKTDIKPFTSGLDVIKQLNPVAFKWKENGNSNVGLNADEVAAISPQLISRDQEGQVMDIKENSINLILINAVKEQQKQIEAQQKQIDELKRLICMDGSKAEVCREKK